MPFPTYRPRKQSTWQMDVATLNLISADHLHEYSVPASFTLSGGPAQARQGEHTCVVFSFSPRTNHLVWCGKTAI